LPYIKQEIRDKIDDDLAIEEPGELNFLVSRLCDGYIAQNGLSYTTLNEIVGVLECAKMEIYRRVAARYEDIKLSENGEVYINAISALEMDGETVVIEPKDQLELFPDAEQVTLTGEAKYGETKFG